MGAPNARCSDRDQALVSFRSPSTANIAFAQSSRSRATLGTLSQLPGDRASAVPLQLPQMLPVGPIRRKTMNPGLLVVSILLMASLSCAQASPTKHLGALTLDHCGEFKIQRTHDGPDFKLFSIENANLQRVASAYLGNHPQLGLCGESLEPLDCAGGFRCFTCSKANTLEIRIEPEVGRAIIQIYDIESSSRTSILRCVSAPEALHSTLRG